MSPTSSEVSAEEWAYIAGIIDGEGTIHVFDNHGANSPRLIVSQKDQRLLKWLQERIGGNLYTRKDGMGSLQLLRQAQVQHVLEHTVGWLLVKGEAARRALEVLVAKVERKAARDARKG